MYGSVPLNEVLMVDREGTGFLETSVTGICELPDVGVGNLSQALWKLDRKHS